MTESNHNPSATDAFSALPPVPQTVLVAGERLDISPLRVGELPVFARTVLPIAAKLSAEPDWLRLMSENGEAAILALGVACRRTPQWVAGLALDEAIGLAQAVFEANADFFIHRVLPQITHASQKMGATLVPGAATTLSGQTPSTGSLAADTVTQTF